VSRPADGRRDWTRRSPSTPASAAEPRIGHRLDALEHDGPVPGRAEPVQVPPGESRIEQAVGVLGQVDGLGAGWHAGPGDVGDTGNPRYLELLHEQHYIHHVLRMPVADWPDPVQRTFAYTNPAIYVSMQGPSELGISAGASLAQWDRTGDLASIEVPALVIGAAHDTMDPAHMEVMAARMPSGQYLHCPDGSHLAMYDDQETYFARPHRIPARPAPPGTRALRR